MKFSIGRFDKSETRTEGLTTGGYSVDLPDGRTQVSLSLFWSAVSKSFYKPDIRDWSSYKTIQCSFYQKVMNIEQAKKGLKRPKQPEKELKALIKT